MKRGFLKGAILGQTENRVKTHGSRIADNAAKTYHAGDVPENMQSSFIKIERAAVSEGLVITQKGFPVGDVENTVCSFYPGTEEVFTKIPGFPYPLQQPAERKFRIAESPGKGLAMFATRALKQGELILSERPLLMRPAAMFVETPPGFTREQTLQHFYKEEEKDLECSVKQMQPRRRAAFLALANSDRESSVLGGIVQTNGLDVGGLRPGVEGTKGMYRAVCEDISRLNHSCSPNTGRVFDKPSFSIRLYAVRDIAKGEELTHPYTDTLEDAATRQRGLQVYDFVCTCPACTVPTAKSDARRKAIADFMANTEWSRDLQLDITRCREQLARIESEGLEHRGEYYAAARTTMNTYALLGDFARAAEWAVKVMQCRWAHDYANLEELIRAEE